MATTELTRTQDLNRVGYCKVHKGEFRPGGHYDRARLVEVGVCADCDSWLTLWRTKEDRQFDNQTDIVVDGEHYIAVSKLDNYQVDPTHSLQDIAENYSASATVKGMGGAKHIVQMNDGRVVITDDLWHQGKVPSHLAYSLFPNNAKFVR